MCMISGSTTSRKRANDVVEVNRLNSSFSLHPVLAPEPYQLSSSEQASSSAHSSRFVGVHRCICGKQLKCIPPSREHCFVRVQPKQVRISRHVRQRRKTELVDARRTVFVTISSGNFLPEADVKQMFSRLGDVVTVRWSRFGLSNGYIITFKSRQHMLDALKVTGSRLEMKQCILSVKWAKPERIEWRIYISLGGGKSLKGRLSLQLSDSTFSDKRPAPVSANELKKIFVNHHRTQYPQDQPESTEVLPNVPGTGPLALPAPYHLLPNTPYFQTAVIVPPPIRCSSPSNRLSLLDSIIHRYLNSMIADDEQCFERIAQMEQRFHFERKLREEYAAAHAVAIKLLIADVPLQWLPMSETDFPSHIMPLYS